MTVASGGGGWMRHGVRAVACLGVLAILLGGRCVRSVGVDAVVAPPGMAEVAAWWRLERHRGGVAFDAAAIERLAAATEVGRAAWRRWLDGSWRAVCASSTAASGNDPEGHPVDALERWKRWRSLSNDADRAREGARVIDATAVAGIVDALGLESGSAARFARWWRLERARRLAGGFAPRGGTPASPETVVAGDLGRLDPAVAMAVLEVLDRSAADRATAIETWATARRDLAVFEQASSRPEWRVDAGDDPVVQDAAIEFNEARAVAAAAFEAARTRVTAMTVRTLVDASLAAGRGGVSDRWRRLAARLAATDLPSMARHAAMLATARRGAEDDADAMATLDAADRRFRDRTRLLEAEIARALELGDETTLPSVLARVPVESASIVSERDAALNPFLGSGRVAEAADQMLDDGWGMWAIDAESLDAETQSQVMPVIRRLLAPPSRSRDGITSPVEGLEDPVATVLLARHDEAYRDTVADALAAMFDEATRIASAAAEDLDAESALRERAFRQARTRLERLVAELDALDASLAESLVVAMPGGLDAVEVDRWLARRMRGRLVIPPDLLIAVMRSGGSMVLVGAPASFERATERAGLSESGVAAAGLVEDDLAEDLGAMRHAVIAALLDDVTRLVRDDADVGDGASGWRHLHRLRDREAAFDRRVRAAVNAGIDGVDAARWLDAWACERNPGLVGWFAIGREGFDAVERLTTGRGDRMALVLAVESWIERRVSLRDEIDAWWSANADPPVVGSEADRLDLLRRSPEVLAAEAVRRDLDGRLALAAVAVLGPEVLEAPFVSRLIASPTPIGLRLAAGPDEPMDEDDLLDLEAEEPVTLRP